MQSTQALAVVLAASLGGGALAADILVTGFNDYGTGTLNGQVVWYQPFIVSWATPGAVNTGQIAANVIGSGVNPGVEPVGGAGRMVRLCTERFVNGRTRAYVDLANSGKWAAASSGGNGVLESTVKLFVPAGSPFPCAFGLMISKDAITSAGGFVVGSADGAISVLNGGSLPANRVATGATAVLGQWNEFSYRWNPASGQATLSVNGLQVFAHTTSVVGGVFATNLLATSDASPGALNAYGFFDDLAIRAVPGAPPPCPSDLNADRTVDGIDLGVLLGGWGGTGAPDLNSDGVVDGIDLGILLGAWGPCPA
jgi:hypothetical protein